MSRLATSLLAAGTILLVIVVALLALGVTGGVDSVASVPVLRIGEETAGQEGQGATTPSSVTSSTSTVPTTTASPGSTSAGPGAGAGQGTGDGKAGKSTVVTGEVRVEAGSQGPPASGGTPQGSGQGSGSGGRGR